MTKTAAPSPRYVMGTFLKVQAQAADALSAQRAAEGFLAKVQHLESALSLHRPESEISRINAAAGRSPVRVGPETLLAVELSLYYKDATLGAFDPLAGSARGPVGLDAAASTVFLERPGMRLDLGGIGKGFALEQALHSVKRFSGLERVYADFGGQLLFWSKTGVFPPERVAVERPGGDGVLREFKIQTNGSVSTSSNAERPGHLLDPRSGAPAKGPACVTVSAPSATEAEALSTALFVAGPEERAAILSRFPGVESFVFAELPLPA